VRRAARARAEQQRVCNARIVGEHLAYVVHEAY
jgi:hypothetical protein